MDQTRDPEKLHKLRQAWGKTVRYLPYEDIFAFVENDLPGFTRTTRNLTYKTPFHPTDMAWNQMDFSHRPWVHQHYTDGVRMVMGKDVCFGFTPWGKWPFLIPTFDYRVSEHEFKQLFSIAGLVYVFMTMKIVPHEKGPESGSDWLVSWDIVSKWYLKPIHFALHRMITGLTQKLYLEDFPVKQHRLQLRKSGYRFKQEEMDYFESTELGCRNVQSPAAPATHVAIKDLQQDQNFIVQTGGRKFIVLKKSQDRFLVWDAVCPHQGGPLEIGTVCGSALRCPWHGLLFSGQELSRAHPLVTSQTFEAGLENDVISIRPIGAS